MINPFGRGSASSNLFQRTLSEVTVGVVKQQSKHNVAQLTSFKASGARTSAPLHDGFRWTNPQIGTTDVACMHGSVSARGAKCLPTRVKYSCTPSLVLDEVSQYSCTPEVSHPRPKKLNVSGVACVFFSKLAMRNLKCSITRSQSCSVQGACSKILYNSVESLRACQENRRQKQGQGVPQQSLCK